MSDIESIECNDCGSVFELLVEDGGVMQEARPNYCPFCGSEMHLDDRDDLSEEEEDDYDYD